MPQEAWRAIWRTILARLQPGAAPPALAWTPTVRPSYGRDEPLPADVELQALHRSADWITKSRILRHPKWPQGSPRSGVALQHRSRHALRRLAHRRRLAGDSRRLQFDDPRRRQPADALRGPQRQHMRSGDAHGPRRDATPPTAAAPRDRRQPARLHIPEIRPCPGQSGQPRQPRVRAGRLVVRFSQLLLERRQRPIDVEHVGGLRVSQPQDGGGWIGRSTAAACRSP